MATSIQRVIIMIIAINMLVIAVNAFNCAMEDESQISTELERQISSYENWSNEYKTGFEQYNPDTQTIINDKQYGNLIFAQKSYYSILKDGISITYFEGCMGEDCSIWYISFISQAVRWFLFIITILGGLEVFWLIYSKKYT